MTSSLAFDGDLPQLLQTRPGARYRYIPLLVYSPARPTARSSLVRRLRSYRSQVTRHTSRTDVTRDDVHDRVRRERALPRSSIPRARADAATDARRLQRSS
eukprot:5234390-Prymnesium_polylepis.1